MQASKEDGNRASGCDKAAGERSGDKQTPNNLIQIPISVTNQAGNPVPNLKAEDFTITEDTRPQQMCNVSADDAPWTIGFVLDNSASTAKHLNWELASITGFVKLANPQNEYFVMTASKPPTLIADFTPLSKQLAVALNAVQPAHSTALLDAINLSVDKMQRARYSRRALVVLSDAGDNSSDHSENDVRSTLLRSSVQMYFIGSPNWDSQVIELGVAIREMQDFTSETGGVMMPVGSAQEFAQAGAAVSALLRHQYVLSYNSDDTQADGKWRKVKVRLAPPARVAHATVYAPSGYYGPSR